MDEIAREAGISKGAVYLHFRSKEALLDALLLRAGGDVMRDVLTRIDADPAGLTIFTLYRYSIVAYIQNPLLKAMMTRDRRVLGSMIERMDRMPSGMKAIDMSVEFVRQMQAVSLIRPDVEPEVMAAMMLALRQGILQLDLSNPNMPSMEALGEGISAMMQAAFGTEHGSSEAGKRALWNLFEVARNMLAQTHRQEGES